MSKEKENTIRFFGLSKPVKLTGKRNLKRFLVDLFLEEGRQLKSINYVFCSDKYLLAINRKYLKHDYYTDVITFNLAESNLPIEADVYISIDRVTANAAALSESFRTELHRVMFHAALHLCGYGDKTPSQQKIMKTKEGYFLGKYFNVSRGTFISQRSNEI